MSLIEFEQRFALYLRYSSELQNEMSLDTQEALCRKAIKKLGSKVVAVFADNAKSGWSLEREGFIALREAAARAEFDAIMCWKFDRLARDLDHAMAIKMLLRHEYGVSLHCVEGFSEDADESPQLEQLLAIFAAFYSQNLSNETKRGKRHRAINGHFNGSVPPLGYDLITRRGASFDRPAGLYVNRDLAEIIGQAFALYAGGEMSDTQIAEWLNQQPQIYSMRKGKQPLNKETVRDLLQNRVYTGQVPYAETLYNGSLGHGKQSNRKRKQ